MSTALVLYVDGPRLVPYRWLADAAGRRGDWYEWLTWEARLIFEWSYSLMPVMYGKGIMAMIDESITRGTNAR